VAQDAQAAGAGWKYQEVQRAAPSIMTPEMAATLPHPETWKCLSPIWPMEGRLVQMKNPLIVGKLTLSGALEMKRHHKELQTKLSRSEAVFGEDYTTPMKMFTEGTTTATTSCTRLCGNGCLSLN